MNRILPSLLALVIALFIIAIVIAIAAENPALAFSALLEGSVGSLDSLSESAVKACPLLLAGIAVAIAFQAGIWNIGAEGQLLVGAMAMSWIGTSATWMPPGLRLVAALLGAMAAGGLWAGISACLKLQRGVSEVISTIMLNFVALWMLSYLVHGPLMEQAGAYPQSDAIPIEARMPRVVSGYRIHYGLAVGLAASLATWVFLYRTVSGFQVRAVGLNPVAARLAGFSVGRNIILAMAASGAIAGLAGGVEIGAVTFRLFERFSPGYGFTAIAVALLGRLHPFGVVLAALFFGALEAGSGAMQRTAGVSSVVASILQSTVIFALLAVEGMRQFQRSDPSSDSELKDRTVAEWT